MHSRDELRSVVVSRGGVGRRSRRLRRAEPVLSRVSTAAGNAQLAGASRQPSASADGRFVAFSSTATTLVAGDTNGSADVFVKDRQTGAVTRVSVLTGGAEALGDSVAPDISADGRYVTFVSAAVLVADDTNPSPAPARPSGAELPRCLPCTIARLAPPSASAWRPSGTQADAASAAPRISGDGRYVVFESIATNLVAGRHQPAASTSSFGTVQTATTTRISVADQRGAKRPRRVLAQHQRRRHPRRLPVRRHHARRHSGSDAVRPGRARLHARVRPDGARAGRRRGWVFAVIASRRVQPRRRSASSRDGRRRLGLTACRSTALRLRPRRASAGCSTASKTFGQLLVRAGSARSSSSCRPSCRPCGLPLAEQPRSRCDRPHPRVLRRGRRCRPRSPPGVRPADLGDGRRGLRATRGARRPQHGTAGLRERLGQRRRPHRRSSPRRAVALVIGRHQCGIRRLRLRSRWRQRRHVARDGRATSA